jgi:hypothetical protein
MRAQRRGSGAAILAGALLALVAAPAPAGAQVFQLQGGTSSQHHATGGTLNVRGDGFDGWLGLGDLESFRVGGLIRREVRGGLLSMGDQAVPFGLPTDVFQSPHSYYGRGLGYEGELGDVRVRAIAGTTATVYGSPFFVGARSDRGAGILFLDHEVSKEVRVSTRSVFSRRQTVVSGLDWTPRPDVSAAVAGGGGAGEPYAAYSFRFERPWIAARAAWTASSESFRRVAVPQPSASEMDRENVDLRVRPVKGLVLQAGRYHFLQPATEQSAAYRGRVHQGQISGSYRRTSGSLSLYDSRGGASGNQGVSLSLGRPIGRWLDLTTNVFHAKERTGETFTSLVGVLRQTLSPHVDLTQVVTHTRGNTTASVGGHYVSGRFTVGAEWQTVYVPFGMGDPFQQALLVSLKINAFGDFTANLGSYVAPDGSVKYTLAGNQYFYRGFDGAGASARPSFSDHLVQGIVTDEKGAPVRGAAIRVDSDLVYTDSDGYFFVRKPKGRICRIEVATSEFLTPLPHMVVSAPEALEAQPEGRGSGAMIVVRPVIPATPKPQPKEWTGPGVAPGPLPQPQPK